MGELSIRDRIRAGGPDYNKCLVNLANSVLDSFGAQTSADTLGSADEYLAKGYRNVIVLLLDGMGISILEKHLKKDGFFRSHLVDTYYSVYPPTTVAATTSLMSGQYPNEHGWLGWDVYYPQIDKNVTVFFNSDQLTEENAEPGPEKAADFNVAYRFTPYESLIDKINADGGQAYISMPYMPPYPKGLEGVLERIKSLCNESGRKYIYGYWDQPDGVMHKTGTMSDAAHEELVSIEEKVKAWADELPSDTLLFITADHSHMDSRNICILDYPEVTDCLVRMPSVEPRTINMFVKEECRNAFPEIFEKCFGEDFILLTREEVLKEKLFGPGENREGLEEMIGDFVALAVTDKSLFITHREAEKMPGGHAGLTAEESLIPLIVVEKP